MKVDMNQRVNEALNLLQEECAEVIVEVSKCNRFGLNTLHYKTGADHRSMLEQEIGDVLALVDVLMEEGIIGHAGLLDAKLKKIDKLKKWSKLYEQN
jgi:NTP pyrophosphatase (non-canonical NTP hydrolase)